MNLTILPNTLSGHIALPPSKSELHRALICAALAEGETQISCACACGDVLATASALAALGAGVTARSEGFFVTPIDAAPRNAVLKCGESGSTLRFLLPVAAALGVECDFLTDGRLMERPLRPLLDVLCAHGCRIQPRRNGLHLSGKLQDGDYEIDASESSQFVSGLLLTLPLLPNSAVLLRTAPVSAGYIDITCAVLRRFGVDIRCADGRFEALGSCKSPGAYTAEGDWSAAAFWLTANALGGCVALQTLCAQSVQGDRAVTALLAQICAGGAVVDCGGVPDLVPPLAVAAALTPGETRFVNAARLRDKESDRLRAVCAMLGALGGDCAETEDGLLICGGSVLRGGTVDPCGDHRIAMAAAIAATRCSGEVVLCDADCVAKSYPDFWRHYQMLGGEIR